METGFQLSARQIVRIRQMNGISRFGKTVEQYINERTALFAGLADLAVQQAGLAPGSPAAAAMIEQVNAYYAGVERATDLQSEGGAQLFGRLLDRVTHTGTRVGSWSKPRPLIATEPGGDVNGYCFTDYAGEAAIVIDEYLMTYALLLSKVVAAALLERPGATTIELDGAGFARRLLQRDTFMRLAELMVAYVEAGTPSGAPQYFQPQGYLHVQHELLDSMEEFIVAHECGHIELGHLDDRWVRAGNSPATLAQLMDDGRPVFQHRYQLEFDADHYGLNLVAQGIDFEAGETQLRLAGPLLFFLGLDLLEKVLFFYATGQNMGAGAASAERIVQRATTMPSTHPPAALRAGMIFATLERSEIPEQLKRVAQFFAEDVHAAFVEAESRLCTILRDHARPDRIHQRWRSRQGEFASLAQPAAGQAPAGTGLSQ